jgi:hypothetical protein
LFFEGGVGEEEEEGMRDPENINNFNLFKLEKKF